MPFNTFKKLFYITKYSAVNDPAIVCIADECLNNTNINKYDIQLTVFKAQLLKKE
jgi:hypothetical protein